MTQGRDSDRSIPFAQPMLGDQERDAVHAVLLGSQLAHGPMAEQFEARFAALLGAVDAVCVSSCTAAMQLVWLALGLGPGDEVIVPAETHVATAHAVEATGARPMFVDVARTTGNLDPSAVEQAITERTRAIAVLHFLGEPANMSAIMAVAERRGLFVLEDCALALGTRSGGVHAGLRGDAGCFSFYPAKHITTGEGGMVVTRHPDLAKKIRRLRSFGVDTAPRDRRVPGQYDVRELGLNCRLSEMQAAIGLHQLERLPGFLAQRRSNWIALHEALGPLERRGILRVLPAADSTNEQSGHYCCAVVLAPELQPAREAVVEGLRGAGVGTSIYYPHPVPLLEYYRRRYDHDVTEFPGAREISYGSIALPVGPHINADGIAHIASAVMTACEGLSPSD